MARKPNWITKTKHKTKNRMVSTRLNEATIQKLNWLCNRYDTYKSSAIEGLIEQAYDKAQAA